MSTYEYVSAKLGKVAPATKSISKEIYDAAKAAGHEIWYMWGMGTSSEHATGRALDLMVRNKAAGDWIRDYIWKNRQRLRLQHVIWWQHITSTVTQPGVVRKMKDRGSVTENHKDHVHVLFFPGDYVPPSGKSSSGSSKKPVTKKSVAEVARDVIAGKYGNGQTRIDKLRAEGYNPAEVQVEVNRLMAGLKAPKKSIRQVAGEVIAGKYGNGEERKKRLEAAGYDPAAVQKEVNRLLGMRVDKSFNDVVIDVIKGKYGNGEERRKRLEREGYDYTKVQAEINRRLRR